MALNLSGMTQLAGSFAVSDRDGQRQRRRVDQFGRHRNRRHIVLSAHQRLDGVGLQDSAGDGDEPGQSAGHVGQRLFAEHPVGPGLGRHGGNRPVRDDPFERIGDENCRSRSLNCDDWPSRTCPIERAHASSLQPPAGRAKSCIFCRFFRRGKSRIFFAYCGTFPKPAIKSLVRKCDYINDERRPHAQHHDGA